MIQSTDVKDRDLPLWRGGKLPAGPARARLLAVSALAGFAFVVGLLVGATAGDKEPGRDVAQRFTAAWERQDWARMYALTDEGTQAGNTVSAFAARYRSAAATATADAFD